MPSAATTTGAEYSVPSEVRTPQMRPLGSRIGSVTLAPSTRVTPATRRGGPDARQEPCVGTPCRNWGSRPTRAREERRGDTSTVDPQPLRVFPASLFGDVDTQPDELLDGARSQAITANLVAGNVTFSSRVTCSPCGQGAQRSLSHQAQHRRRRRRTPSGSSRGPSSLTHTDDLHGRV